MGSVGKKETGKYLVGLGGECDPDNMEYMEENSPTKAIGLFIELFPEKIKDWLQDYSLKEEIYFEVYKLEKPRSYKATVEFNYKLEKLSREIQKP